MSVSSYDLDRLRTRRGGVAMSDVVERFCQVGVNAGKPGPCPSAVDDEDANGPDSMVPSKEEHDAATGPGPKTKQAAETAILGAKYKLSHAKNALANAPAGSEMAALLKGKVAALSNEIDALGKIKDTLPDQPHPESYVANKKVLAVKSNISKTKKALADPNISTPVKASLEKKLEGLKIEEAEAQKAKKAALAKEKGGKVPPSVAKVVELDKPAPTSDATAKMAKAIADHKKTLDVKEPPKDKTLAQATLDVQAAKEAFEVAKKSGDAALFKQAADKFTAAVAVKNSFLTDYLPDPVAPMLTPPPGPKPAKPPFDLAKVDYAKKQKLAEIDQKIADWKKAAGTYAASDPMNAKLLGHAKHEEALKAMYVEAWKKDYEAGIVTPKPKASGTAGLAPGTSMAAAKAPKGPGLEYKPIKGHEYDAPPDDWAKISNKQFTVGSGNHFLPEQSRWGLAVPGASKAVAAYTGSAYSTLNKALYSGEPLTGTVAKVHAGMQKAFAATPTFKEPVNVLRGIGGENMEFVQKILDGAKKSKDTGEPLVFGGYASTSTNPGVAVGFGGGGGSKVPDIMMKIKAIRGVDAKPVSHFSHEHELILNAGSKFDVKNIFHDKKKNIYYVELDQRKDEGFAEGQAGITVDLGSSHERMTALNTAMARAERDNDDAFGEADDLADWLNDRHVTVSEEETKAIVRHFAGTGLTLVVDGDGLWTVEEVDYDAPPRQDPPQEMAEQVTVDQVRDQLTRRHDELSAKHGSEQAKAVIRAAADLVCGVKAYSERPASVSQAPTFSPDAVVREALSGVVDAIKALPKPNSRRELEFDPKTGRVVGWRDT